MLRMQTDDQLIDITFSDLQYEFFQVHLTYRWTCYSYRLILGWLTQSMFAHIHVMS